MVTKARQLAEFIANADVDSDEIATGAVSASKLAATLDLSSKTIVMPDVASFNITSGNVGIGTSSPVRDIQIGDNTGSAAVVSLQTTTTGNGSIYFGDNTATSAEYAGMLRYSHSDNAMQFWTNSAEKMRITSTGSVGIGTTTPSSPKFSGTASGILELKGSKPSFNIQESDVTDAHFNMSMSNGSAYLGATGTGNLVFATGTASWAEKMRITSAGNVGIGTSSPATSISGSAQGLAIQHSNVPFLSLEHTGASGKRYTLYSNSAGALVTYDEDASTERMRISSGGLVGIGTDSPASKLHLQSTNSSVIKLETTAANTYPGINFINDAQRYDMQIDGATDSFRIYDSTASSSRIVLDTSGNLLVGKAVTSSNTDGTTLWAGGFLNSTVSIANANTSYVARFNRKTTDGPIVDLHKDGSTVGSIGTNGSYIYVGSGDVNLRFHAAADAILPATTGGATRDSSIDLGTSGAKYKDLYLSGGVYAGGGSSATNGRTLLEGYYSDGALPVLGSLRSSGNTMLGRAVEPSSTVGNGFNSSSSQNLSRSAIVLGGNEILFKGAGSSTTAKGTAVTMNEYAAIDPDGIKLPAGKGIKFDAYGSSNILDDYESGTFNVRLTDGTNTSDIKQFAYVKTGDAVHIHGPLGGASYFIVAATGTGAGADLSFVGSLPYTPQDEGGIVSSTFRGMRCSDGVSIIGNGIMPVLGWRSGSTTMYLDHTKDETSYSYANSIERDSTRTNIVMNFNGWYRTSQ